MIEIRRERRIATSARSPLIKPNQPGQQGSTRCCRPAELADDFRVRAYVIVRSWLGGDVEGLVALVGDNADELLPDFLAYSADRS